MVGRGSGGPAASTGSAAVPPGSPTTAELVERGARVTLFVNEILTVRPGSCLDFLAAVVEQRVPLLGVRARATGIYEVIKTGTKWSWSGRPTSRAGPPGWRTVT